MGSPHLSIVYADVNVRVREVVSSALVERGVDVRACATDAQAIALCREALPDAVLLDLRPPGFEGLETARAVRRDPSLTHLRLVAMTGYGTWELRTRALEAGFDEFVIKPAPADALIRALQSSVRDAKPS